MAINNPKVSKVFDDLEDYLDFCRFELREFNPAHLYDKGNENYRAFLASKRPRGNYKGNRFDPNYKARKNFQR
jgi:hypothetical protein